MDLLSSAVVGSLAAKRRPAAARPPFECIALLLQGGGALGSYQSVPRSWLLNANVTD